MVFKRKLYDKMLRWKQESNGETALLIEGARRIGKSTLVEEFAKNEYKSFILIDFSQNSEEVNGLFKDITDLDYLFLRLQVIYGTTLYERKSVIVFDEVQQNPLARQAIKHLVKDHRYDYIETGSLISIRKNIKDIVIPSEEVRLPMYPMDFEEFRWALGDTASIPLLRKLFESRKPLGMSPAQLISGPGAAEAVSPAANAASSLAQHSLVRALAEEIVEAALRRSGEWAGLDAAETGNAPDGAYRYALYEAHGAARVPYAYGILGQQRLDGEWKTVAMIAPFSNDSAATAHLARLCTGQQLEPIHILDVIHDFMNTEARTL